MYNSVRGPFFLTINEYKHARLDLASTEGISMVLMGNTNGAIGLKNVIMMPTSTYLYVACEVILLPNRLPFSRLLQTSFVWITDANLPSEFLKEILGEWIKTKRNIDISSVQNMGRFYPQWETLPIVSFADLDDWVTGCQ